MQCYHQLNSNKVRGCAIIREKQRKECERTRKEREKAKERKEKKEGILLHEKIAAVLVCIDVVGGVLIRYNPLAVVPIGGPFGRYFGGGHASSIRSLRMECS